MKLEKFKEKNKKRTGLIIFTSICVLLIAAVFLYRSYALFEVVDEKNVISGTVKEPGDLYFAFYVDNNISNTMPEKKDGYIFDTEKSTCTKGATPEFDETLWAIKVLNMTEPHTKCTLYFKK